jgi:hypothetical protein
VQLAGLQKHEHEHEAWTDPDTGQAGLVRKIGIREKELTSARFQPLARVGLGLVK